MVCCSSYLCASTGLVGLLIVLAIRYWFKFGRNHYWKERNVPCDPPVPFFGSFLKLFWGSGSTFFHLDQQWYKKYGRVFGAYEHSTPILYVAEPELLRSIFVKDFHIFPSRRPFQTEDKIAKLFVTILSGEDWKRVRSVISPAFSTGKMKKMVHLVRDCAETTIQNFLKAAETGETVETKRIFGAYFLDTIASTTFGTKLDSANDPQNIFVENVQSTLNTDYPWRIMMTYFFPRLSRFLRITTQQKDVKQFFIDLAEAVIKKRKETKEVRHDMLQILLDATNNKSSEEIQIVEDEGEEKNEENALDADSPFQQMSKTKTISKDEFLAQCLLLFTAGYDGTANTIALVPYYLATNPDCEKKLLSEVDRIWKKYPDFGYEAVSEATYLDNVISETLRLSPPGVRLERHAAQDYLLGDTGITIPKGMNIMISTYSMHRDPELFPDPETFNPDRFLPENKANIKPYSYMPFGDGPRHCLGMRLALLAIKVALLNVFRHVTFEIGPETEVPLKFYKGAFQYQPRSISLKIKKRHH